MIRERDSAIDWLRASSLATLVFFHTCLVFTPVDYFVHNNTYSHLIFLVVLHTSTWFPAILFFISGMATWHALQGSTAKEFLLARSKKILIPLAFGALVFIPYTLWLTLPSGTPLLLLKNLIELQPIDGTRAAINLHHLWFLAYLAIYIVLGMPLCKRIASAQWQKHIKRAAQHVGEWPALFICLALPLIFSISLLKPENSTYRLIIDDWDNFVTYFILYLYGYTIASSKEWLSVVEKHWVKLLYAAGILICVFVSYNSYLVAPTSFNNSMLAATFVSLSRLTFILALLGLFCSAFYKPSNVIHYINNGAIAFYIIHQPILLTVAYYTVPLSLPLGLKFVTILVSTYVASLTAYEGIKQLPALCWLFGVYKRNR